MQSASSKIWTSVAESIFHDDIHHTVADPSFYFVTFKNLVPNQKDWKGDLTLP